ncbi:MAG: hypothetical protein O3A84_05225 [Proteobacteria bacterium]|nr:hypothetical protein [Pseudomonadota bacterium]
MSERGKEEAALREVRLAQALRDNLQRRKQQTRDRDESDGGADRAADRELPDNGPSSDKER